MHKHILLPYDFDNSFSNVPEQIKNIAPADDHLITIFHVIPEGEVSDSVIFEMRYYPDLVKQKESQLAPFLQELDELGLNWEVKFQSGRVSSTIMKDINGHDYDIVVMSNRHSKRELKHVLGNVTQKIAKRANIPVLIVK